MSTKKRQQELQLLRDEALDDYMNREDFQYDINADALYRQYEDRYQKLGREAMEDTMGQAAALTGGYGSSYAQNVGQQAYQKQLSQLSDVIPELYQLAYERYQDRSDALYRTYQAYDAQEKEAAEQLRWEQEQQAKQQEAAQPAENPYGSSYDDTYYSWLSYHQGKGQRPSASDPTLKLNFDNGDVSTGNVMTMQRVLGLEETGMWTLTDKGKAGGLTADEAWKAYTKGQLQMRSPVTQGDVGVLTANVRAMERALRLKDDGIWSKEDQKAAGGLTEAQAWIQYQKGLLQNRRS